MKISIVIPTRNRGYYLNYCIKTCLACEDAELEVIVSDNDSQDNTREIVGDFKDPRVRYFNTGKSVSMRQNFEFALSHATGDYVIFIGDDDGVLKNGMKVLRGILKKYAPDIVNWRHITYKWPRQNPYPQDGVLKFRYRDFCGALYTRAPDTYLKKFANMDVLNYRDGGNIYHGCISRRLIERLKQKTGQYFQGQIPDVYAAMANLAEAESFLWLRNPVTIAGESEKSNGVATLSRDGGSEEQKSIARNFFDLADADEVLPELDMRIRAVPAYTYANIHRVNNLFLDGKLAINHAKWREKISEEVSLFDAGSGQSTASLLDTFYADIDQTYKPSAGDVSAASGAVSSTAMPKSDAYVHQPPVKMDRRLQTVETVACWLDAVTGCGFYRPVAGGMVDHILRPLRTARMWLNLKKLRN
jgi:glycosyltransferase involved in cell wall biosynthesis